MHEPADHRGARPVHGGDGEDDRGAERDRERAEQHREDEGAEFGGECDHALRLRGDPRITQAPGPEPQHMYCSFVRIRAILQNGILSRPLRPVLPDLEMAFWLLRNGLLSQ